jgi:hypothetical protein
MFIFLLTFLPISSYAVGVELKNTTTAATFGPDGMLSIEDIESHSKVGIARDAWSLTIDGTTMRSTEARPAISQMVNEIAYTYKLHGYQVKISYHLNPGWRFVGKQIEVLHAPHTTFTVDRVVPWDLTVKSAVISDFVPSTYVPQFGATIEESRKSLPGKDFGEFLRLPENYGAMLTVQNPFLNVQRNGQSVTIAYAPAMQWQQEWGTFESDMACMGTYRLTGRRKPREMVKEWHLPPAQMPNDGMDEAEVDAFATCVRAFLINPAPAPISVEVGWTLNDYQIDVGTEEGKAEYKRVIDTASDLGIQTLLYAPGNSKLAARAQNTDEWGWEYVLWLNLGQKIRKGEWDPETDAIPDSVSEMVSYAKQKHVGLLAYAYPSIPFAANPSWIVKKSDSGREETRYRFATLGSHELQDYLIRKLIAFQKRTGIAGYSFDYTWLDLPGSSSYSQWYGWRRVMQTLRKEVPSLVIDGRQSYQTYGPWSWLAGNYPHPTGNDEQAESFKPYPDLHFDRVSANRMRFVNYWYRNYQFAPEEVIPGYATHQTERSRNIPNENGSGYKEETIYTSYRPRDWDYLGYQYSFISSIAAGGWNNVVNMIPGRDLEEAKLFSSADKAWIRDWLNWTVQNKEYLRHTRTILDQPAIGHVDGTAAIAGDRGFLFLFNPNYKQMSAGFSLDSTIGLTKGERFLLREVYPQKGRLFGKPNTGVWNRGDTVHLQLDGTSATVFELIPEEKVAAPVLFNAATLHSDAPSSVILKEQTLSIAHVAGEPGTVQEIGVLLPNNTKISDVMVNGNAQKFKQSGSYVETEVRFAGTRFAQAQEITVEQSMDSSLTGTFVVPQSVFNQLAAHKVEWPIHWTKEDYESTWLVPERLLLFVQAADGKDTMTITGTLDGQPLGLQPAYSSSRTHAASFVGFYADLSKIAPDTRHTIKLQVPKMAPGQLQGVFFDNVTPQLTELLVP